MMSRQVAACSSVTADLKLYRQFLDRHQVWRSHDPMSIRIFHFVKIKKDFIPHFWFASFLYKLPQVTRGY